MGAVEASLEAMAATVDPRAPTACAHAAAWDGVTVEAWLTGRIASPVVLREWRLFVRTIVRARACLGALCRVVCLIA
jgi:hypothetical protein